MVAFGVVITFILSITFLPAALSLIRFHVSSRVTPVSLHMTSIAKFVVSRKKARYRLRGDTDFVEKNLTGMNALEYPVSTGTSGGIADPAYLQTLERFEQWLQSQDKVTATVSIVEIFRDLNRSMNGGDPKHHVIPDTRELAAQLLLLYEMSLPFGQELTHQIDIEQRTSKVVALVKNASSADLYRPVFDICVYIPTKYLLDAVWIALCAGCYLFYFDFCVAQSPIGITKPGAESGSRSYGFRCLGLFCWHSRFVGCNSGRNNTGYRGG